MALAEKDRHCVESKEWIRANHMRLLVDWREEAVRNAKRDYVNSQGQRYLASLSNNCMECHSNKSQFCDQCHNYVGGDTKLLGLSSGTKRKSKWRRRRRSDGYE